MPQVEASKKPLRGFSWEEMLQRWVPLGEKAAGLGEAWGSHGTLRGEISGARRKRPSPTCESTPSPFLSGHPASWHPDAQLRLYRPSIPPL